jgi:hypothetical protein
VTTASSAEAQYEELKALGGDGYEALIVIAEDGQSNTPSTGYCNQFTTQHGLTMPVLMGTASVIAMFGVMSKNHWNIVVGQGAEVVYKNNFDDAGAKAAIEALLAP